MPGSDRVRDSPPAAGSPRISQIGDAGRGRVRQVGEAAVPVAVVEQDGAGRVGVELGQRLGLGVDVAGGPRRVRRADGRAIASSRSSYGPLGRIVAIIDDQRPAGWPADRAARASRAGARPPAARPRSSRPSCARRPGGRARSRPAARIERRDVGRVVAEAVMADPVPGPAVTGQVRARRPVGRSPPAPARPATRSAADAVTPWSSRSGRSAGSPQASAENGIPAASIVDGSPGPGGRGERGRDGGAAGRSAWPGSCAGVTRRTIAQPRPAVAGAMRRAASR